MIDSRDFIAAKHRAETEIMLPPGPKVALTGGLDFNDHRLIWDRLDKVRAKHSDMVLIHGGSPKGAELIAAKWATSRKVPQIAFKPDWIRHAKAAPFKRNDAMLELLPIGVMHFPGTGTQDNLADKGEAARRRGVEMRRRVSADLPSSTPPKTELLRRNCAWFRLYTLPCAAVVVEGAITTSMHMEPPPCSLLGFS